MIGCRCRWSSITMDELTVSIDNGDPLRQYREVGFLAA